MKKCRACKQPFSPSNSLQIVCRAKCAIEYAQKQGARKRETEKREWRKETQRRRQATKTRQDWLKEAQSEFNKFIRLRDADLPCISCGRHHEGQYHAGHYRSVGSTPELRFNELNVQKQCSVCNNHKSGNIVEYRINLVQRIGRAAVDWLEGPHEPLKLTIDEIKEIKREYRDKARQLQKKREAA